MSTDMLKEVTQSILAVMVVGATFYILITQPASSALPIATTAMGAILGFYYSRLSTNAGVSAVLRAQEK